MTTTKGRLCVAMIRSQYISAALTVAVVLSALFTDGSTQCYRTTSNCQGAFTSLDSIMDCCVGDGVSYNDGSGCRVCYVIGFSVETRALQLDEGEAGVLTVQVLKPAVGTPAAELAIEFQIDNTANSADIRVGGQSNPTGTVSTGGESGRSASFTVRAEADQVGQEGKEVFEVPLRITSEGLSEPVFIMGSASVTVTDMSVVIIELTEREYQVREGQGSNVIVARISYSRDIVNPITLRFFPVTYTEYSARSFTLSPDFPAREEGPEFEAGESDFIGDVITVTLPRPGGGTNRVVEVIIPIVDDTIIEHQETFVGYFVIADAVDPSTISLGVAAVQIIINDNDTPLIGLQQTSYMVGEGLQGVAVCAEVRSGIIEGDIIITLSTADNTAQSPRDYTETVRLLTFQTGQVSVCTALRIINDGILEEDESFNFMLTTADPLVLLNPRQGSVVIRDDDSLVIGLEQTSYPVREDDQRVRVCACVKEGSIEPGTGTELVVTLSTFENTANVQEDYIETMERFVFSAESLSDCTELDIVNDDILEDEETFHILLTSDDSRVLLNPQQGFVMIVDDDLSTATSTMSTTARNTHSQPINTPTASSSSSLNRVAIIGAAVALVVVVVVIAGMALIIVVLLRKCKQKGHFDVAHTFSNEAYKTTKGGGGGTPNNDYVLHTVTAK